ncbi:MAG TPA: carboxypeptidase-like regulatory domain-containing protein, partial [Ignavibacteria bacterium]
MTFKKIFNILLLIFFSYTVGYSITPGIIEGYVRDAATKEPLPYANVRILGTSMGAAADLNG